MNYFTIIQAYFFVNFIDARSMDQDDLETLEQITFNDIGDAWITHPNKANFEDFPFIASLTTRDNRHYCGGSLISDRHVLTAAHCEFVLDSDFVVLGDVKRPKEKRFAWDRSQEVGSKEACKFSATEKFVHPKFKFSISPPTFDFQILKLNESIFSRRFRPPQRKVNIFRPVSLPDIYLSFQGGRHDNDYRMMNFYLQNCQVAGWGATKGYPVGEPGGVSDAGTTETKDKNDIYPETLMYQDFDIMDKQQCLKTWATKQNYDTSKINQAMVCASGDNSSKTCYGDSGGPLVCDFRGGRILIGVVSWGEFGCVDSKFPSIFGDVRYVGDWVKSVLDGRVRNEKEKASGGKSTKGPVFGTVFA